MASSVAVAGSDVVVLRDDRYRVGESERQIPGWRFRNTVDVGIAADGGKLVVLAVTARAAYYRTGPEWGPWVRIAGWRGKSGDVAVAAGELIVVGEGRYRVGWGADAPWLAIPDWQPGAVAADVADLDGDGRPELVTGSGGYLVHAIDHRGKEPDGWPKFTGHWIAASAAVGDVDGDGLLEVVVPTREGSLYVWDTNGPVQVGGRPAVQWGKFHHDLRNTGNYHAPIDDPAAARRPVRARR